MRIKAICRFFITISLCAMHLSDGGTSVAKVDKGCRFAARLAGLPEISAAIIGAYIISIIMDINTNKPDLRFCTHNFYHKKDSLAKSSRRTVAVVPIVWRYNTS